MNIPICLLTYQRYNSLKIKKSIFFLTTHKTYNQNDSHISDYLILIQHFKNTQNKKAVEKLLLLSSFRILEINVIL